MVINLSPLTNLPLSSIIIIRSASPSWAIPRLAPWSLVALIRSIKFSSMGSLALGKKPFGEQLISITSQPIPFKRRGVITEPAPPPQSRTTLTLKGILSPSVMCSICSLTAESYLVTTFIFSQEAMGILFSIIWSSICFLCLASKAEPSELNSFIPLYCGGLWEAVIIMPASNSLAAKASVGVGTIPAS